MAAGCPQISGVSRAFSPEGETLLSHGAMRHQGSMKTG
jgi:hypothetical protein